VSSDFLEQLAQMHVAEPPPAFDRQLHQRVNRSLLVRHLVEFFTGAFLWAFGQWMRDLPHGSFIP